MKHEGRGVIRMDDQTDHGGHIISASSGTKVMGKIAALADDMTYCPRCKGNFAIKPDGKGSKHNGRPYAYHNDVTECGARLISSLSFPSATVATVPISEDVAAPVSLFDDKFILIDSETGLGAPFVSYAILRANGNVEHGITNAAGETHMLSAVASAETIQIYAEGAI